MSVRVARFEVGRVHGDHKEVFARWSELADDCQHITNFVWQQWLVWHVKNKSADKIRKYLDALEQWRNAEQKGEKPKLGLFAIDKSLLNDIYHAVAKRFTTTHGRVQVLLENIIGKKIKERKAARGNLSGWMAILLSHESMPSSTRQQPIPFDRANAEICAPLNDGDNFRLKLRIDRIARKGKSATATLDEVELITKKRKMHGQTAILWKILRGEAKFCGSSLTYHARKRKWFALICWQSLVEEPKPTLDLNKSAYLRPCRKHPWEVIVGDSRRWLLGRAPHISAIRQQLLTQRWSRQANYRFAGSANKGHGRKRALLPIERLSERWKDFVKTNNHQATTEAVRACVAAGAGTLVYMQPVESKREARYLAWAGKVDGREDSTGWDWSQVAAMLGYKCQDAGIELVIRKQGELKKRIADCTARKREKLPAKRTAKRSLRQAAV